MRWQAKQTLATKALRLALEVRKKAKKALDQPICVYDLADELDIAVRFCDIDSLGGMFVKELNQIFVPARRPPGRQAFSCAHEIGHWCFGHGTRVDGLSDLDMGSADEEEEFLANCFAGHLLMPRDAVTEAFRIRGCSPDAAGPLEFYTVAGQLGVGYSTLIQQMRYTLKKISPQRADSLLLATPKSIRAELGLSDWSRVVLADLAWRTVAIDLRVGDTVILPVRAALDGPCVQAVGNHALGTLAEAVRPGIGRAVQEEADWAAHIRVCRAHYEGIASYRHLEDPDDE